MVISGGMVGSALLAATVGVGSGAVGNSVIVGVTVGVGLGVLDSEQPPSSTVDRRKESRRVDVFFMEARSYRVLGVNDYSVA